MKSLAGQMSRSFRTVSGAKPLRLLVFLVALAGCTSQSTADLVSGGAAEAVPVTVATAVRRDVPRNLRAIGTVEPYATVAVKAQVEGQLARVTFIEGQEVKRGDLLFLIDPRPFEAALAQAKANLARDKAEASNADVEAGRFVELLRQGVASKQEHDQARTRSASMAAAAKADAAAVVRAELELEYCTIRSPIDGRMGKQLVHQGNVVKPNETTLAVINQIRPVYVELSVPQQELAEVRKQMARGPLAVEAAPPAEGSPAAHGELTFVNNTVDPTTGTVMLRALFQNDDETLWPGQFVDVSLTLSTSHDVVVVPARAVQTGQAGKYVFVVKPDKSAELRPVVPGLELAGDVVVESGLEAGEQVVTDGQIRLAPGLAVVVRAGGAPGTEEKP
jgi:multidrug efflux system membrane fusion protein